MSTLTSAQLCVKRSSTRLHAPPGGRSTLSFGPGGFGAADAPEDKADADPALGPGRPASRGDAVYGGPGPSLASASTTDYYAVPPASSCGPPGSSWGRPPNAAAQWGPPPSTSSQWGPPPSSSAPSQWGATPPSAVIHGRPASSASGRWGGQPPLTASKRDQNWERKRRLWLARKNAGGPQDGHGGSHGGPHGGWPAAADDAFACTAMPPASPLSKFMHQHADRLPTAVPSADPYFYRADGRSPPPTASYPATGPPPTANYAATYAGGPSYNYSAPPSSSGSGSGSGSGRGPTPSTAASTTTTRAGSRQPPGGHSNWSPFS